MNYRTPAPYLICAALIFACAGSQAEDVVSAEKIAEKVALQNIHLDGQTVRGQVVNRSGHRLEDVKLLIAYNWLWRNEFKPGSQSPAWATTMVLSESLDPNEVYDFAYNPERTIMSGDDGEFHPSVKIIGLTEYTRPDER